MPNIFDFKYLIYFITGVLFGFLFLALVYLYSAIIAVNRKNRKLKLNPPHIDELEIGLLIKDAQEQFKNKSTRKEVGLATHLKTICLELANDIADKYYPTSKYPLLELTVEESLMLTHYIANRVEEFLSAKILAVIKRRTLAQIKFLYDTKVKIGDMKIVKAAEEANVKKIGKTVLGVLNAVNPAYWVKRITVDKLYDLIIVRISLAVIAITGEETYKVYSKRVFVEPKDLDLNIDSIYEEIKGEL
ncbi:MAG: hypothetical protein WCS12_00530 [Acholeplasmataceae bacterium]|nr:hypothetical protein [Acholeplasmataceae bacterium]MCK9234311.1 hypothetical protein [Acholeplasmataceae bacterium]MCK9289143.1 hypothetical protein [Acholeplasmataceae bacterium]MCK9427093.1 hypothetical protein [Acholeplasmataceae bacterium]HHT39553.1 hypothetical protein [Acholeplasmataceae bacterium]